MKLTHQIIEAMEFTGIDYDYQGPYLWNATDGLGQHWEVRPLIAAMDPVGVTMHVVEVHRPGGHWTSGVGETNELAVKSAIGLAYLTDQAEDVL